MAYYMSIFSPDTWLEARDKVAFGVSGHTEAMYHQDEIGPGDRTICWITGISEVVGVQLITTLKYEQHDQKDRIWDGGGLPQVWLTPDV